MLIKGSNNFKAEIRVTFNTNRRIESWVLDPFAESCDEGFRVRVDRDVVGQLVIHDQVEAGGKVRVIVSEKVEYVC